MELKDINKMIFRYLLLIVLALGNLVLFYTIFRPLTVYPVYMVLKTLYSAVLVGQDTIFFKGYAQIIPACIAGSAYYFLLILNLTTPMDLRKRIYSLLFLISSFLILNVARIITFAILLFVGYEYFDLTHRLTWYVGSTFLVVAIWFLSTWLFKIKSIPVWTDIKSIAEDIKRRQ